MTEVGLTIDEVAFLAWAFVETERRRGQRISGIELFNDWKELTGSDLNMGSTIGRIVKIHDNQ